MSAPGLVERLVANVEAQRELLKEYHLLTPDEQKGIRHQLYVHTGGFGRAFAECFDKFRELEFKIAEKKTRE